VLALGRVVFVYVSRDEEYNKSLTVLLGWPQNGTESLATVTSSSSGQFILCNSPKFLNISELT